MPTKTCLASLLLLAAACPALAETMAPPGTGPGLAAPAAPAPAPGSAPGSTPGTAPGAARVAPTPAPGSKKVGDWDVAEQRTAAGALQSCSMTIHYDGGLNMGVAADASSTVVIIGDPKGRFTAGLNYTANVHFDTGPVIQAISQTATPQVLLIQATPPILDSLVKAQTMIIDVNNHVYFDPVPGVAAAYAALKACSAGFPPK